MDQYDEEISAMEAKLDRLSRLVVVLPADSPERAGVQEEGLLLYRELEDAREALPARRQRDAAAAARRERDRRDRAKAARRSSAWGRGAAWTAIPGVMVALISLPAQSWQLRLIGFSLVIVGALCLMRMAGLNRLDAQQPADFKATGQSPSARRPASTPEVSDTFSQYDTLELPRNGSS